MESGNVKKDALVWAQGILIFGFFALSTLFTVMIKGQYLYLYIAALIAVLTIVYAITHKKTAALPSILIPLLFLSFFSGYLTSALYPLPEAYTYTALLVPLLKLPYLFMIAYIYARLKVDKSILDAVVLGYKVTIVLQLVWIPIQYIGYHKFGVDVGNLVFNEWLHCDVTASFIRENIYHPSGFSWHSGLIAPMFVIGFLIFKNPIVRIILIMEAMIVGSSTAVAGVIGAAGLMVLVAIVRPKQFREEVKESLENTPKIVLYLLGGAIAAGLVYVFASGLYRSAVDSVQYLLYRLLHSQENGSTRAHFGYFRQYFEIIRQVPLVNVLFGYGADCSGYPFQELYHYYMTLSTYVIECDYINIALNHGIIGFVIFYAMLGYIAVKGAEKDLRYPVFVLCILVQGIGYNVQWDYVLLFELVMFATLKADVNFFDFRMRKKHETTLAKNGFVRFLVRV